MLHNNDKTINPQTDELPPITPYHEVKYLCDKNKVNLEGLESYFLFHVHEKMDQSTQALNIIPEAPASSKLGMPIDDYNFFKLGYALANLFAYDKRSDQKKPENVFNFKK